ncbi:MAG: DUF4153 domain-containing protein [Deltaproteobacteria bacterium]
MDSRTNPHGHGGSTVMEAPPVRHERVAVADEPGEPPSPPVGPRELLAVLGLVVLADLTIYRGCGFAGMAALFSVGPILLFFGAPQRRIGIDAGVVGTMLLLLTGALLWCGAGWHLAVGAALFIAFAMSLVGMRPGVVDLVLFACVTIVTGGAGLSKYLRSLNRVARLVPRAAWLKVVLPIVAVLGFGTLFVCANPDEAKTIGQWLERAWNVVWEHLCAFSPTAPEALLWLATAWIAGGFLRPLLKTAVLVERRGTTAGDDAAAESLIETPLYPALRNTLAAVIVLFAAYLAFEFQSLWFRVFPKGFYYAGYAHEGAAWLTAALALATAVLSAIFRPGVLQDPRLPRLRKLAWFWSLENLLLAVAVYHRMYIYIGFNGMTRMRTVGLLGISAVVVGFVLVVWKIVRGRGFVWLINRQLWTLGAAIFLYAVLPVDLLVHTYNVRRILAGDLAPSVQISVHPIHSGGILALHPLVKCENEAIREGIKAMLAERALRAEEIELRRATENWTSFQLADRLLLDQLRGLNSDWSRYADAGKRQAALQRYRDYAYQWY